MEQYQSGFRMENHYSPINSSAEKTGFSLGTCSLTEPRKLEPAKPQIETDALNALNSELNNVSSGQTGWAYCTDTESGDKAEIAKSDSETSVKFVNPSDTDNKQVSRYSDGSISVKLHRKDLGNERFTVYNTAGMMTFNSYNTNDQTRIDEFFDAEGKLSQTTLFHIDREQKVNQEIIFTGTEKKLKSMTDRYWDGRTDVFTADDQGKLKLQKK